MAYDYGLNYGCPVFLEESKQCIDKEGIKEQIRKDLANAYADYLSQSRDQAAWPTVNGVSQFHWNEFEKYGCLHRHLVELRADQHQSGLAIGAQIVVDV